QEDVLQVVRKGRAERPEADRRGALGQISHATTFGRRVLCPPAGAYSNVAQGRGAAPRRGDRPRRLGFEGFMDTYIRTTAFLSRVAGVAAAFLIGGAVLVICDMVIERYILNLTTIWQIDVVTYAIVGATFVGSSYVLMTRGHVNVEILPLHIGPRARYWLALATGGLALGFCIVLWAVCTQYWFQAYSEGWKSNTVWRARLWIPYLSM